MVKGFLQVQGLKIEKSRLLAIQYTQQLVVVSASILDLQVVLAHYANTIKKKQALSKS